MLALASAALFGSMTVALRFALAREPDAEAGAVQTIAAALLVTLPFVAGRRDRPRRDLALPPRRRARARAARSSSSRWPCATRARRARRSPSARRRSSRSRSRCVLLDEPAKAGRDRRGDPDRHGRDPARARARPARAREVDRPRLRARGDDRLRGARQPRPAPVARHRRRAGPRRRVDALRRRSSPSPCGCSSPGGGSRRRASAPSSPPGVLFGLSYVCLFEAYYRGRVTVVSPLVATESLWGVALSALLLRRHELVGPRLFGGAALVVAGGALIGVFR